jgi:Heme NO binding.
MLKWLRNFLEQKPPIVNIEPISSNKAIFSYNSKREMYDYFLGLLEGSAEFF